MERIEIHASSVYDVLVGEGLAMRAGCEIARLVSPRTLALVTDENAGARYADRVETSLWKAGFSVLKKVLPAGETHKNLDTLGNLLEFWAENRLTRTDLAVALGGGVVGDLTGFAAAVYQRGIPFVQIPTTLLCAVDASVGGKTAVNLPAGKNLAGCFHQPSLVLCDTGILRELPPELLSEGAAEAIKCGLLRDAELFYRMGEANWDAQMDQIVARCVKIKRDLVEEDEFDRGSRRLLNLGHTFGHAIERCSGYEISHGKAVALGLALSAAAAGKTGLCREILRINRACSLPVTLPYPASELAKAALADKKRAGNEITLVLPEEAGLCRLKTVSTDELPALFERAACGMEEAR